MSGVIFQKIDNITLGRPILIWISISHCDMAEIQLV